MFIYLDRIRETDLDNVSQEMWIIPGKERVVVYPYTIKHHSVGSPLDPPLYIVVPPTRCM